MADSGQLSINLALQGGGSHGAFTWGVLDRLLEEECLEIEGISGASSGAMNATVLAYGMAKNGRDGARAALRDFWGRIANEFSEIFHAPVQIPGLGMFSDTESPMLDTYLALTETFSPYQLNPLDMNPLRKVVEDCIDFDYLKQHPGMKLFIGTTQVRTGKLKIFDNATINIDALLASACLPSIHRAIEIDGELYWDGGFSGNPPVFPLIFNCRHRDIIIVLLHPLEKMELPTTAEEIRERTTELGFSTAFMREMRAIAFSKKIIENDSKSGHLEDRMKNINIHLIRDQALLTRYKSRSKYNTLPSFINKLYQEGYAIGNSWLENHLGTLGKNSSVNLAEIFC